MNDDSLKRVGELLTIIAERVKEFEHKADALGSIEATLILNCQPDRALGKLGITYNEKASILTNLVDILLKMVNKIDELKEDRGPVLTLVEAQKQRRCRICGKDASNSTHLVYNFGKEFAHPKCLVKDEPEQPAS